ncbi:deoxyribose-phosphate aldolase [Propionimicrobium sp. PCR01-08-3]|uniref:deoxyribose-phosphate aldolase n=1 Tax=Propionimicrobium sp. PCR01-08-3 TaxID=3052086 RepID=UPI00255C7962|nr:deoxyribose-phosphate aldolase [Propionimicrobium sp. PCR01-08-3]WIY83048.1 deoxyribose-phosphate aldolase [Propionimicrobium sp. PCR01-08-3]
MTMTVAEYAKHFDMALHLQSSTEDDIRAHARHAVEANVAACYTSSYWTPVVAEELKGSDLRVGTAISFPYGCTSTAMKFAEIEEGLEVGATAVDMVVNIGRLRAGDNDFVRNEVEGLAERVQGKAISKVIFEVCFLTDGEIATLTRICSDAGIDYVKTATGSEGFPTEHQVKVMRDNITNPATQLKVSGVPRTFTLPATLWMIEKLGVSLIGTRSAADLVDQYAAYLGQE